MNYQQHFTSYDKNAEQRRFRKVKKAQKKIKSLTLEDGLRDRLKLEIFTRKRKTNL